MGGSVKTAGADLVAAVQHNCDVSDARHAGEYALCTYLLKMREFYRWHAGLEFSDPLPHADVGAFVEHRESLWEQLADARYRPLAIEGREYDPFAAEEINPVLLPRGLVYSAGYGRYGKPYFFLGELLHVEASGDTRIFVSGAEYARELVAVPAMAQGRDIFVRRESMKRMLWEKVEEWRWRKRDNALARALGSYDFDNRTADALERMTDNELDNAILHEIGEVVAGGLLGRHWEEMLSDVSRTTAELHARAVRDHLADCLTSLPAMLEESNPASIHFYFANLSALRRELFPTLDRAYQDFAAARDLAPLKRAVREGRSHWLSLSNRILDLWHADGAGSARPIERLVAASHF
jgi:hypothetical protein